MQVAYAVEHLQSALVAGVVRGAAATTQRAEEASVELCPPLDYQLGNQDSLVRSDTSLAAQKEC